LKKKALPFSVFKRGRINGLIKTPIRGVTIFPRRFLNLENLVHSPDFTNPFAYSNAALRTISPFGTTNEKKFGNPT
jgi:hypothetical protein